MAQPFGLPGWPFADGVHSVMLVRVWKVPGTYSTPPNPEVCFSLMLHRFSYFAASSWSHKFAIVGLSWPKLKVNNPGWYWKKFKTGEGSYISSLFVEARGIFWSNLLPHEVMMLVSMMALALRVTSQEHGQRANSTAEPLLSAAFAMGDALQQRQLNPTPLPT